MLHPPRRDESPHVSEARRCLWFVELRHTLLPWLMWWRERYRRVVGCDMMPVEETSKLFLARPSFNSVTCHTVEGFQLLVSVQGSSGVEQRRFRPTRDDRETLGPWLVSRVFR